VIDSTVRLVGATQSVTLTDTVAGLMRQPKGGGWGMAPVVNSWFEGAGDGARLRGTRRTQRELSIPIRAFANGRSAIESAIRLLAQSIHDPFKVFVDFHDGRSYWIEAAYDSGAEGLYGDAPEVYADVPLILKCHDPYWTSATSQSFTVAPTPASEPFLPHWAGLHVGSAVALGDIAVTNIGDVASQPTWTIHGPGVNPAITLNGRGFTITRTLTDTEVITIKFADGGWSIVDQTGANLYASLEPAPYFIEFPPGTSIIHIAMGSTGDASFIQCIYPERREVVY